LIFYQILSINSSGKCIEISLENFYVDVGGLRVKRVPLSGEMKGRDLNVVT